MAEKRFAGIGGTVQAPEVTADFESAKVFDNLRVGKLGIYYKDGLRTRYMAYELIQRAFIRIQEVNGRMCCGNTYFYYFRLVLVSGGKEYSEVMSEDEKAMDDALACIHENAPAIAIGVEKK